MTNHDIELPPQNLDAERSVLCLEIIDPVGSSVEFAIMEVAPEDFYSDVHATIQRAVVTVYDRDGVATILTVSEELRLRGVYEDVGGDEYLQFLRTFIYLGPHARYHARIVADLAKKRRLIELAKTLLARGYDPEESPAEVYADFSDKMIKIGGSIMTAKSRPKTLQEHQLSVAAKYAAGEKPTRFIGIGALDDALGGVAKGENVVIGGATSHGKTMVCLQWLQQAAANGVSSMIVSKEMRGDSLGDRTMKVVTALDRSEFHGSNELLVADIQRHYEHKSPIVVFEDCVTMTDVERAIEVGVKDYGVGIVALDYLQLIKGDGQNKEQQVANVSNRFKQAVLKHNIIGLCLAQINKEWERGNRKPTISDLRESGAIGQDADIVVFVYWEAKIPSMQDAKANEFKLIIAKNRQRGARVSEVLMRVDPSRQWLFPVEEGFLEDRFYEG